MKLTMALYISLATLAKADDYSGVFCSAHECEEKGLHGKPMTQTPEPGTMLMVVSGLGLTIAATRRIQERFHGRSR